MYWALGGVHGPHHVAQDWADKYKGKFDQGWDKLREEIFARQKKLGWIPADTELTARDKTMPAWFRGREEKRRLGLVKASRRMPPQRDLQGKTCRNP